MIPLQKYYCFLFDTCFAIARPTRRFSKRYNLSCPVVAKGDMCVQVEEKNSAEIGFKIGEHFFMTEDGHKKRHWIDSFGKLRPAVSISGKIHSTEDKENLSSNTEASQPNTYVTRTSISRRTSTSSISDNHVSFSLRKTLLRQKRNSIGYI